MEKTYKEKLEQNIVKFAWYKVFTKRIYLPVIAIFLVEKGMVSVGEIALIAGISVAVQILLQMPGGYFADKFGNSKVMKYSSLFITASPLFYIALPNFWGGLLASVLFFGGWAFQQGAGEAFMHDTLVALGREREYAKVMGKSQSYGLVGNLILTAFVPATYSLNPMLPFMLGFITLVAMTMIVLSFEYPNSESEEHGAAMKSPIRAIRNVVTVQNVALFVFAGFVTSISMTGSEYQGLILQSVGVTALWLGIVTSLGSLFGALLGLFTDTLNRLKPNTFYVLDIVVNAGCLLLAGATRESFVIAFAFIIFLGYGRIRLIVVQSKMLADIQHRYKASLLSALALFTQLAQVLTVAIFGWLITGHGYQGGYVLYSVFALVTGGLLLLPVIRLHKT